MADGTRLSVHWRFYTFCVINLLMFLSPAILLKQILVGVIL
jgi:hypothetical protein